MNLLDKVNSPDDIKHFSIEELEQLTEEIRQLIKQVVSQNGGHLASSLGAAELVVALNYVFDFSKDRLLFDVGHQCYVHKVLTGRKEEFKKLRKKDGLSGFPNPDESEYDPFKVGHASTSISTALGYSVGHSIQKQDRHAVAFIGDASMTGGMVFEALNNAGHIKKNLVIVLNDNNMAIAESVGAFSEHLSHIRAGAFYNKLKHDIHDTLAKFSNFGDLVEKAFLKIKDTIKSGLVPGHLFDALGIRYLGPFDGHNMEEMVKIFSQVKGLEGPTIIHAITEKGRGYLPASSSPGDYHYAGPTNMPDYNNGCEAPKVNGTPYSKIFGNKVVELAEKDPNVVAITAAMPGGTGLTRFAQMFPDRFFDVGITEPHALAFGAGLAASGIKPFVPIYSVFLQRSYDQIFEELCLQKNIGVVVGIDRAGLVGEDGSTHHGIFDIAYLRHMPNMILMAPRDQKELEDMIQFAYAQKTPVFIRYPKGVAPELPEDFPRADIALGKGEVLKEGTEVAVFALGATIPAALEAADLLKEKNISLSVVNPRFVCPLDTDLVSEIAGKHKLLVTAEDGILAGGFGSAIAEHLTDNNLSSRLLRLGIKDKFIEHGSRGELLEMVGLDAKGIANSITEALSG